MAYRQQRFSMVAPFFLFIFFVWESKISEFTKITIDNSNFL